MPVAPLKIVIVEDDALIAMFLEELLELEGHQVCATAASQDQAVAAALRYQPDLMIVDGSLGQDSGVAAMAQILAHGPMPHLYVTGDVRHIAELAPGAVILGKPFTLNSLVAGIAQVVRPAA